MLLALVHATVYQTLAAAFSINGPWLIATFSVLSVTFVAASIVARKKHDRLTNAFYIFAAYWFGLVHFLFVGGVAFFFIITVMAALNIYFPLALVGAVCFGTLFLLHAYGTWESTRLLVTTVNPRLINIPASWQGKRAVFVSDLHLGTVWGRAFAARAVRRIQALGPDAIFIGGDLYDGSACDLDDVIAPFKSLNPDYGTFFVTGNHEYYLDSPKDSLDAVRRAGIRILNDEKVDIGGITLIGIDYKSGTHAENFKQVLAGMEILWGSPTILLKHEPTHLEIAREAGITLGLFGHTHRGQIFPLNLLTRRIYHGFDYGMKLFGAMRVYTSSGAGTWGPPLRLGTRSEIVCIEF